MIRKLNTGAEKRMSDRYVHRGYGVLKMLSPVNGLLPHWDVHLINVSATGALIAILDESADVIRQAPVNLTIEQETGNIELEGKVAHRKLHYVGIKCQAIDDVHSDKLARFIKTLSKIKEVERES